MTADIIIGLHADFARACAKELQAAGYASTTGSDADIIHSYANVRNRSVSARPRKLHKASYKVSAHLVAGEPAFLTAVVACDNLRPYQSTRPAKTDFDDGMLNDFGIQHFHLGTMPHTASGN